MRLFATALAVSIFSPGAAFAQAGQAVVIPELAPVAADDKIRCRKIMVTGSWVKAEKVCKTVGEWRRLADRGNDVARDHWQSGLVCTGGECRGSEVAAP